ncbi:MAG TPA: hypothetical protein VGR38_05165 [Candidatus Polarisedimenticolia bacterium]|nr:hypothetical protein [Candidatus Polarisedimenticolia bacterium]
MMVAFFAVPSFAHDAETVPGRAPMSELWVEPSDLSSRDLFYGPGGSALAPRSDTEFRFTGEDTRGHSKGYDVKDPQGRKWDVKIGEEAQAEVAVSRILWAIGYHQPVAYYVPRWRMNGGPTSKPDPGRFRLSSDHKTLGDWSWSKNPFVDTRPLHGLIVINTLLNNWDLTKSNNRIYGGTKGSRQTHRRYVVQDVGGSLAKTKWPVGTRNNIEEFESQNLLKSVHDDHVEFDYRARHQMLLGDISPADVAWACRLLDRLSDRQLDDAFRAGGYSKPIRERFARKIRQKIQEGLELENPPRRSH